MAEERSKAPLSLQEETYFAQARRHHLEAAQECLNRYGREAPDPDILFDALLELKAVVEMLSTGEERVIRLHAECVAMIEQAGKILALDASLRPVIVKVEGVESDER